MELFHIVLLSNFVENLNIHVALAGVTLITAQTKLRDILYRKIKEK